MAPERLAKLARAGFAHIYAALRAGITGSKTTIDEKTIAFLDAVGAGGSKVYGGFGITTGEQSRALASSVDAIVAGSVFVRIIAEHKDDSQKLAAAITAKARELTGE